MKAYLNYEKTMHTTHDDFNPKTYEGRRDSYAEYTDIFLSGQNLTWQGDSLEVPDYPSGTTIWGVYAIYSTGDSFSKDENGEIELLFVSDDHDDVYKVYATLRGFKDKNDYHCTVTAKGKEYSIYCPWLGYFETLESLEIIEGVV